MWISNAQKICIYDFRYFLIASSIAIRQNNLMNGFSFGVFFFLSSSLSLSLKQATFFSFWLLSFRFVFCCSTIIIICWANFSEIFHYTTFCETVWRSLSGILIKMLSWNATRSYTTINSTQPNTHAHTAKRSYYTLAVANGLGSHIVVFDRLHVQPPKASCKADDKKKQQETQKGMICLTIRCKTGIRF